ncbi:hypothetical protein GGS21DRAFT_441901 [Xylaria nigripes]|nr:hypothetical protein GGS21DRAFT_441901 [Xylaria nigripes]
MTTEVGRSGHGARLRLRFQLSLFSLFFYRSIFLPLAWCWYCRYKECVRACSSCRSTYKTHPGFRIGSGSCRIHPSLTAPRFYLIVFYPRLLGGMRE